MSSSQLPVPRGECSLPDNSLDPAHPISEHYRPTSRSWQDQRLQSTNSQSAMGITMGSILEMNSIVMHGPEHARLLNGTGTWIAPGTLGQGFGAVEQHSTNTQHVGTACVPSHLHDHASIQQLSDPNYHTYAMHITWSGNSENSTQDAGGVSYPGDKHPAAVPASTVHDYRKIAPDLNATYYHCPHLFGYAMTDQQSEGATESGSSYAGESFEIQGTATSHNQYPQLNKIPPAGDMAGMESAGTQHSNPTLPSDGPSSQWASGLQPQEQTPRHAGDLYTPRWVRGNGTAREGWCDICHSWKVLKNSAYWYDKTFVHSISTITGRPFDGPIQVRAARSGGNAAFEAQSAGSRGRSRQRSSSSRVVADMQGQCGHCGSWVKLNSNQRQTASGSVEHTWGLLWLKHAHKCHSRRHGAHSRSTN